MMWQNTIRGNHLYKLSVDGLILGGAILFADGLKLNIGRIFVQMLFIKNWAMSSIREMMSLFTIQKNRPLHNNIK